MEQAAQSPTTEASPAASKEDLWYVDNYVLLKDYHDRTVSRIAARCVRKGNIAIEEYPFYPYILDVLEEISEVGGHILKHKELYPAVEKKIAGGMEAFRKSLGEYNLELQRNSSPDMIRGDPNEAKRMKDALGGIGKADNPLAGAGMNMDELMAKLTANDAAAQKKLAEEAADPNAGTAMSAEALAKTEAQALDEQEKAQAKGKDKGLTELLGEFEAQINDPVSGGGRQDGSGNPAGGQP